MHKKFSSNTAKLMIKSTRKFLYTPKHLWNNSLGIGWEHKITKNSPSLLKTEDEGDLLLDKDIKSICNFMSKHITVDLNQNQIDALISLIYDIGTIAFTYSVLKSKLNKNDFDGACSEFRTWTKWNGESVYRLSKLRRTEIDLFNKGN